MPRITELYAFIVTEAPGEEGVPAIRLNDNMVYPLFGADQARVDSLRKMAQELSNTTGMTMKLARFSVREELEEITPQGRGGRHGP